MSNYKNKFLVDAKNHPWNLAFDLVREKTQVLDVGCSNGAFGEALQKYKRCEVDGIEPDIGDAKKASKLLREVKIGFVEEVLTTSLRNRKYDHIVFLDVIEHLVDPVSVLKLTKKHLNPGGSIIFSIPNMAHMSVRLMLLSGEFEYGETGLLDKTHLHFYTKKEIERVFSESGLKVDILKYVEVAYSNIMIGDELQKAGLMLADNKKVLFNDTSAQAFQYIGSAIKGSQTKNPRRIFSPDPQGTQSAWFEKAYGHKEKEIENIKRELKALKIENDEQKALLNNELALAKMIGIKKIVKHRLVEKIKVTKNSKNTGQ